MKRYLVLNTLGMSTTYGSDDLGEAMLDARRASKNPTAGRYSVKVAATGEIIAEFEAGEEVNA